MAAIPGMTVTFDDGTTVRVEPKQRDMVRAEAAGADFTTEGMVLAKMYAVAFAALQRMGRAGALPDGVELPGSLDEFLDSADLEGDPDDDEDAEGKG